MVAMLIEKMPAEKAMMKKKKKQQHPPVVAEEQALELTSNAADESENPGMEDVTLSSGVPGDEKAVAPQSGKSEKNKKKKKKKKSSEVALSGVTGEESEKVREKRKKKKLKFQEAAGRTAGEVEEEASGDGGVESTASAPEPVGMQIYWNLSSVDASVREAASAALVRELIGAQRDYEDRGLGQEEKAAEAVILGEAKTEEDGLKDCAPAVQYALRRLVRGAASSRESARQGFALALAAVLGALPCISAIAVLTMIKKHLEVVPSMKGPESRDALLGQLFAYGALIRSSRAIGVGNTSEQQEVVKEVAERLLTLAKKKTFLREPANFLLVQLGEQLGASGLQKGYCESPLFLEILKEEPGSISADTLFLVLRLHQKLPKSILESCPLIPKSGNLSDIFENDQLSLLVPCLMESSCSHPRVHSVWDPLLVILFSNAEPSKKNKKKRRPEESTMEMRLITFWTIVVDGALLLSSHERKNLAMKLLLLFLARLPAPSHIKYILSRNFVQCLLAACASKDNLLYKAANNCIAEVCKWAEGDEERRISVVIAFQQSSQGRFDNLSRTKSVKGLIGGLTTITGYQSTFQAFSSLYAAAETSEGAGIMTSASNSKRQKSPVVDLEVEGGNVSQGSGQQRWAVDQLRTLCQQALVGLPAKVVIEELIAKFVPSLVPLQPFTEDEEGAVATLQATMLQVSIVLSNIESGEKKDRLQAMLSLLVQLLFESRLLPSVAVETASEIAICCKKAFGDLVELDVESEGEDVESPAFMDVLVDVLLSLLAQPSAPIRSAAEQVFKSFSGDLTSSGLTDLLRIIKKNTQRSRHKPVVEVDGQKDDDEDILDVEESDEESADEKDDESGSDEAEDPSESDEDNADMSAVEEKVTTPSKRRQNVSSAPEGKDDDEESEVSDLDDETMFRMDKHLAVMLKQRQQGGGNGTEDSKDAQTQLLHFKFRVLALLDFFLQKHSGSMLVLTMLPSLLHVFVNSCTTDGNSQVADRVSSILQKQLFRGKQYPKGPEVDQSSLKDLLRKALKLASRSTVKRVSLMAQATCRWILKVIHGNLGQERDVTVEEIFSAALEDFFVHKKCRLPSSFFKECFTQIPWLGNHLLEALLEKCLTARSEFLRWESIQLAGTVLGFKNGKFSNKPKQQSSDLSLQPMAESLKPRLASLNKVIAQLLLLAPSLKATRRLDALQFCVSTLELLQSLYPHRTVQDSIDLSSIGTLLKDVNAPANSRLSGLIVKLQQIEEKCRQP